MPEAVCNPKGGPVIPAAPTPIGRMLKLSEVAAKTGLGRTTIYRYIGAHSFPQPVKFTVGCSRWNETEVDRWIQDKSRC